MKILSANGARTIAQTAHHHMRTFLVSCNAKGGDQLGSLTSAPKPPHPPQRGVHVENKSLTKRASVCSCECDGPNMATSGAMKGGKTLVENGDIVDESGQSQCEGTPGSSMGHLKDIVDQKLGMTKKGGSTVPSVEVATSDTPAPQSKPSAMTPSYSPSINSFTLNCGNPNLDLKRFLDVIGTEPKEARYWFKYFQKMTNSNPLFAVIQVEEDIIRQSEAIHRPQDDVYDLTSNSPLKELCSYLAFLQRHDMKCVLVHGRCLPPHATSDEIQEVQSTIVHDAQLIIDLLEKNGANVRQIGIPPVHVTTSRQSSDSYTVSDIDPSYLQWTQSSSHIPILCNIGLTPSRELVNVDLFDMTAALSKALLPLKVLIVNMQGGIVDTDGKVIPNINLPHDELAAFRSPWCTNQVKQKISDIRTLLTELQMEQVRFGARPDSAVIITSATTLLTELFTHYGSGTFFKITEKINVYKDLSDVDTKRLLDLIQVSFGKTLKPDYIDSMTDDLDTIFISEGYSAAAVITREPGVCIPYLDKFVVNRDQQDNAVGRMLWDRVCHVYPNLFWRSRNTNLINPWYFKRSEGSWSDGEWTVFWYGIQEHRKTSILIDYALSKPNSFKAPDPLLAEAKSKRSSGWSALKFM